MEFLTITTGFTNVVKTFGIFYHYVEGQQDTSEHRILEEENEFLRLRFGI
jgi:hypothetical protein